MPAVMRGQTVDLDFFSAAQRMAEIIREAAKDPAIVAKARQLVGGLAGGDYVSEAAALHSYVRDKIRYTGDPFAEDLYTWPQLTLIQKAGDCNNKVLLFGALAKSIGFPVRILFAFREPRPDLHKDFPAHVLAAVDVYKGERSRKQWWPVEATPLPNQTNGFPTVKVPLGFQPALEGGHLEAVDVDAGN